MTLENEFSMLRSLPGSLTIIALCNLPIAVCAQPAAYRIDIAHSEVNFDVHSLGVFTYGGRFSRFTGTVTLDPSHWESLQLNVQIPVDSLQSRPAIWRGSLLGPRFFDAARHPSISFSAMQAERTGPGSAQATGNLTIRGITRPLSLSIGAAPDGRAIDIDTETKLKRSDFGLGGMLPFTSDVVTVVLRLRILPQTAKH